MRITPIISRHDGVEMAELGAGGGKGDLDQQHELEVGDAGALGMLMSLCATKMQGQPKLLSSIMEMLASIMRDPVRAIALDSALLHPEQSDLHPEDFTELEQMPLDRLIPILASLAAKKGERSNEDATVLPAAQETNPTDRGTNLPNRIVSGVPSQCRTSFVDDLCRLSLTPGTPHTRSSAI